MYDIAIIGAGPAGLSAGITARARNKNTIIVSNRLQDNPLSKSRLVENYPGLPGIDGERLLTKMTEHAQALGCEIRHARVITVLPLEGDSTTFLVSTSTDTIEAQSVILAVGSSAGGQPFDGETEYVGRGVSYCATCDGMLFRNATVCVVGLSPDAREEADFLAEIGATVHYLAPSLPEKAAEKSPASIITHKATLLAIEGDDTRVVGVRVNETTDKGSAEVYIPCQGVFILRPSVAPASLLATLELAEESIKVDQRMRTNIAGVFAAGDCTGKPLQVAKAVGEGQIACLSAVEYLDTRQIR